MITELAKQELGEMGRRARAAYLVEQAGYTLGVAALDGAALEEMLPEGFLKEVATARDAVHAAIQDKKLMSEEAKDATKAQSAAFGNAKAWRRKVVGLAKAASRQGKHVPEGLLEITSVSRGPNLTKQVVEMTKLLESSLSCFSPKVQDPLLSEGKALIQTLTDADATQEVKRFSELPTAVQKFFVDKGTLYQGLKIINDTGHSLHAGDARAAAQYNLTILHRKGRRGGKNNGGEQPATKPAA